MFSTEYAPASMVSFNWRDIENHGELKQEPDRQQYFNALSYHQFKLGEMRNGEAWRLIRKWVL